MFLAIHINTVENIQNIFMEHDLYKTQITFGVKENGSF